MKLLYRHIGLFALLVSVSYYAQGQARIVVSDDAFITVENGAFLVIDNKADNAIATAGTGGNIVSEGETNVVRWLVTDTTGTYTVPFTTMPISQGGNGIKVPVSVTFNAAGAEQTAGAAAIDFSTFETDNDDNTPFPTSVNTMQNVNNADIGLLSVDRFWLLAPVDYTTPPGGNLQLSYDESGNEMGGSNTITEANLQGTSFDENASLWQDGVGTVDATNNNVSGITIDPANYNKTFTLVDGVEDDGPCTFNIFKMFTPDGDNLNDTWEIDCIQQTPNNTVRIVNRWGDEVANFTGYDNQTVVWDGMSRTGKQLGAGTYFYIIDIQDTGERHSGWVHLIR